ncbi:MAG TPA: ABC transporter permease [Bryobacteraceae bacterium]|nr:ABC transporter permease [Bryobacteraceae bacterium]
MNSRFELFIASRYLSAHRKQAVISIITVISILGVAAGVMALVVALGVNNGFRSTLQRNLLGAMAHIDVTPKEPGPGIENWRELADRLRKLPHVTAVAPALYSEVFLTGPLRSTGALLKGIDPDAEMNILTSLRHLKAGSLDRLRDAGANPPGIILGARLAEDIGMPVGANLNVVSPQGELAGPLGIRPAIRRFRVAGIFETGFFEVDDKWAFTSIGAEQRMLSIPDTVNRIELNVDDLNRAGEYAPEVAKTAGPLYTTDTWMEQNHQLMAALNMERVVTIITIGLIEIVAALNIFITLVMMVMEKYRDIAVLMSMGARQQQIRRIFWAQGVLIGMVGSVIGLAVGYALCYYANRYQWVHLDPTVYALSFVPFEPRWLDGFWIAALAIVVSFLATIYPARNATRIAPAEVLRYE